MAHQRLGTAGGGPVAGLPGTWAQGEVNLGVEGPSPWAVVQGVVWRVEVPVVA